nr:twin-arginine translocase subunit TatC [Eisenibacter elegans]
MSFIDHLEELRWHLIRSGAAIFVFGIAAFLAKPFVFGVVILGPSRTDFWTYQALCQLSELLQTKALCINQLNFTIQSRQMAGQFMMHLTSSAVIGLILAFPYAFWEIWSFIRPGLYPAEQKAARGATFFVSLLFILGVLFGYYIISPLSINFLAGYTLDPSIINEFDIISYVSTLTSIVLASAILFQLPVFVYFLAAAGLISAAFLRTYRRHAIVIILVVAAVLTPPDMFSQVLIFLPLSVLYEISISITARVERKRIKSLGMSTTE